MREMNHQAPGGVMAPPAHHSGGWDRVSTAGSWIRRHPVHCVMACIASFGLLLRLRGLNYCMSPDEALVFDCLIRNGFRAVSLGPYGSGNHVLNSLCTWLAYSLFGIQDWAFQLPSLIFGMGGVLLAYPVGAELFGSRRAGLAAAFFMACAPFHVAYSANSRGYTAVIFFVLLSALHMNRNLRRPGAAGFIGLALATFFMGMSQLSSLALFSAWGVVMGVMTACFASVNAWRTRTRLWCLVTTCAALGTGLALINLGYAPMFSLFEGAFTRVFQGHWSPDMNTFLTGAEQSYWQPFWRFTETNTGLRDGAFWAASFLALTGVTVSAAKKHWAALIALAGIVCPIASYLAINLKLEPRYTMTILPFWVLAFGAGAAHITDMAGWIVSRIPRVAGPVIRVFQCAVFAGIATAYCIAILPLYSSTPALACVFNDFKSAARYLAAHMDGNDIVAYEDAGRNTVEHYLNRCVFPALQPSEEPSPRSRVWLLTMQSGAEDAQSCLPGCGLTLAATLDGCTVWSGEVNAPNLHKVALAPFPISNGSGHRDCLAPWVMSDMPDDVEVAVDDIIEGTPSRCLRVITPACRYDWRLYCPQQSCPPGRVVLFRADTRGDGGLWDTGVFLRFYDDQHNQIGDRVMRVPCKGATDSLWKRLQQVQIAPPKTRYVSAGLQVSQPSYPGRTTLFRNVELWIDEPPAPVAAGGT